ncbi:MAG: FkbM family methyltransferase [Candidatus Acidiferrales bacterium]
MKLKELPYLLGLQPGPKTYGFKIKTFDLPDDGTIECAQWLHPKDLGTNITQAAVNALRKFLSPGDVALDIGAHSGDSSIPIALAVGKQGCVLAFEPNRYVFPVLKKNSELNADRTKIIPLMFAATPRDAELEFLYSDSGFCNGGRFEGMSRVRHGHTFRLKVEGRNLESLLTAQFPEFVPRIRYIKTDTEGYEAEVLESLGGLLPSLKPYLKVEVYGRLDDAQRRQLHRSIASLGYEIRKIVDDGDYFGETLAEGDMSRWRHYDIFCIPK